MKLVYVAGPYTAPDFLGIDENIIRAREACAILAERGIGFLSPHMNSAHFEVITPDVPYQFWIEMTLEMLRRCDAVYVLDRWEKSSGTRGEIAEAERLDKPVFYNLSLLVEWWREVQE